MRFRMHKRTETKPDGRKIYYYQFEPVDESSGSTPPMPPSQEGQQARKASSEGDSPFPQAEREACTDPHPRHAERSEASQTLRLRLRVTKGRCSG
ncbi:MAG: hypothetical protein SNJ72_08725 [Fimbriimonadales bacterium]